MTGEVACGLILLLYDHWVVEVVAKDAVFGQRFRIVGSDASDGDYPSQVGTGVSATGRAGR